MEEMSSNSDVGIAIKIPRLTALRPVTLKWI